VLTRHEVKQAAACGRCQRSHTALHHLSYCLLTPDLHVRDVRPYKVCKCLTPDPVCLRQVNLPLSAGHVQNKCWISKAVCHREVTEILHNILSATLCNPWPLPQLLPNPLAQPHTHCISKAPQEPKPYAALRHRCAWAGQRQQEA
jgi:hypothetical protein